ncbi:lysylphosphatidylglycerol synthase transmembrane domain-containing protein [Candidatus Thiosymbion oneisti]|uniref:lysylphosphatidylglycerol synthase transmembrane domain-containing protein n=1 Tax=Candidatus Thiosymbion oneisti TaxID=589554 RepID=UPI000AE37549|nr:lysylphosphatidylglycerol synthase transmembrane domain-containing protein [Candidatus Thiosymbion oneisti]
MRLRALRDSGPWIGRARDWGLGGILLAIVVTSVALTLGWGPILASWRALTPAELLPPMALTALSYCLRGVRIHDYFHPRLRGRFPAVLRLSVLHTTANNLLPMRAGELVFPWLMRRYFGHGFLSTTASLIWIRLLDLHFLGLMGILILWLRHPTWLWSLVALPWLLLLPIMGRLGHRQPNGQGRLGKAFRLMIDAAPASTSRALRIYLWTALIWISKLLAFALVLRYFLAAEPWEVLLGVMGAELSSVLPFHGIAGSGSYELAVMTALLPLGIDAATALTGAINLHLFLLGVTLLLGALAFLLPVRRDRQVTNVL